MVWFALTIVLGMCIAALLAIMQSPLPRRSRRPFQFSLRALIIAVATIAVALALGTRWWARSEAISVLSSVADYDYDFGLAIVNFEGTDIGNDDLKKLRRHLENHPNLVSLILRGTNVTDSGLVNLVHLRNLQYLDLRETNVTDDGVSMLRSTLPDLQDIRR